MYGVSRVDGILADLGVSSHQFDEPQRGFSLRFDAPLDMRMGTGSGKTAADLLAQLEEEALTQLFRAYGEVQGAHKLARLICKERIERPIDTTGALVALAGRMAHPAKQQKYVAQVFQALRIAVNDELEALKALLQQSVELLKPGGRLAVISYHSLEDRMVKHFMRAGNFTGEVEKDFYGNPLGPFKLISRSAIAPDSEETQRNSRARSARLRIAERNE
jgi:16S rRNA (cytosine1402-N4)-methyltransferase